MLKHRIITAMWLIPLVLGMIFFLPLNYFSWILVAIFLVAAKEWGRIIDSRCNIIQWSFALTVGILLIAINILVPSKQIWFQNQLNPIFFILLTIGAIWWGMALLLVISFPKTANFWSQSNMLKSMFGQFTLVPCFIALIALKALNTADSPYYGATLVLLVMLTVWAADTGAYVAGKALGKHKLMPRVSPAKTLEGLIGGLLSTMLVVFGVMIASSEQEFGLVIMVTLLVALVSVLGDLSESMFKRAAGIKDSGAILPGHGGLLDRIDSLTAALPVFTLIYIVFWM